jgi:diguanylate cyclase (GGDEF)-like protein
MSVSLASSLETDTILRVILEQATLLTDARSAALLAPGERGPATLLSLGAAGLDLASHSDAVQRGLDGESKLAPDGSSMVIPVGERGAALLLVGDPGMLNREKYFRVSALAASAAVTLGNALQYQQRAQEAITDGLTGLLNNRELRRRLQAEQSHFGRLGKPYALLLIDLDKFKEINDALGHQHGDSILQGVAEVVRRTIRAHDLAARYGGDELAVIALEAGSQEAAELANRLLEAVRGAALPATPGKSVTLSIGSAACPDDATGVEELIMAADQALYLAKRQGRNRAATSSELVRMFQSDPQALAGALRDAGPLVALAAARTLDWLHHRGSRHASRVAAAAHTLASRAGRSSEELEYVRLVALLHELPHESRLGPLDALLSPRFPPGVVEAVGSIGDQRAEGAPTDAGRWPFAARVVALADRYDELVSGDGTGQGMAPAEAVERMRADGLGYDLELLDHLVDLAPRRPLLHTDTIIAAPPRLDLA